MSFAGDNAPRLGAALNTIFKVKPKDTPIIRSFLKERFLAVATVIVIGFLLLVALIIDTGISAAGDYTQHRLSGAKGCGMWWSSSSPPP